MKNNLIMIAVLAVFSLTPATAIAHSGRTDSSGGHNCSASSQAKGLCSGYHYHNGGTSNSVTTPQPVAPIVTVYVAPTTKPTATPTIKPTTKPSPTSTPTLIPSPSPNPTISSTPIPSPEVKAVQAQAKKSKGFFDWFFSLFRK